MQQIHFYIKDGEIFFLLCKSYFNVQSVEQLWLLVSFPIQGSTTYDKIVFIITFSIITFATFMYECFSVILSADKCSWSTFLFPFLQEQFQHIFLYLSEKYFFCFGQHGNVAVAILLDFDDSCCTFVQLCFKIRFASFHFSLRHFLLWHLQEADSFA